MAPEDQPPLAPSSRSSSTDDFCYVFLVELERGPSGLGMGLIDGMVGGPGLPFTTDGPQRVWSPGRRWGGPSRAWGQGLGCSISVEFERKEGALCRSHLPDLLCHLCPQTLGHVSWACGDSDGIQCCLCRHTGDLHQAGPLGWEWG